MKKLLCVLFMAVSFISPVMAGNVLVAYFSATGNTKSVAEKLANSINAELFEIVPEQAYTKDDLDWHNKESRSSVEMSDETSRPAISSQIEDIAQYKIIFLGSPIWWGREPAIIDTFAESYDFSDKLIIPFVTSGSSDIGQTGVNIQKLMPGAKVLKGKRFTSDVSDAELQSWAEFEMQNN